MKVNVNQRYATTPTTHAILKEVAAEAGVPLQVGELSSKGACPNLLNFPEDDRTQRFALWIDSWPYSGDCPRTTDGGCW